MTAVRLRCLVVRSPYAEAIASGRKTVEVRSWSPCDGLGAPRGVEDHGVLIVVAHQPRVRLSGTAICVAYFSRYPRRLDASDQWASCIPADQFRALLNGKRQQFAWPIERVLRLADPFPLRGRLGMWVETVDSNRLRGAWADAWQEAIPVQEVKEQGR